MSLRSTLFNPGRHDAAADFGLLVLRLVAGGSMAIAHGWGKLQTLLGPNPQFGDPLGIGEMPSLVLATFGELVGAGLVAVGLCTRWAAIPTAITMAVAFFVVHGADPFGTKELAFLYLGIFTALVFTGGGRFSLDGLLSRRRS